MLRWRRGAGGGGRRRSRMPAAGAAALRSLPAWFELAGGDHLCSPRGPEARADRRHVGMELRNSLPSAVVIDHPNTTFGSLLVANPVSSPPPRVCP